MDSIDEKLGEAAAIENDIQGMTLKELLNQKNGLSSRVNLLSNEISDLAFNNYRTYADAGRTAEHCKEKFSNIHNNINEVKTQMPNLVETVKGFFDNTKTFHKEYDVVTSVSDRNSLLWKITAMPQMIEKCIQSGEYESAFALTDFAVNLKNSRLYNHEIIKKPVDYIIEARHGLLDELFDKFTGPIDLAKNILIVNNIRKIPYISNTQLRISILHYRDIYLENLVSDAMKDPDYVYKLVDIYRDCMYDTMVLYLAVFPDGDVQRRSLTAHDSKWERWTGSSQNYLLQAWAHKNLVQLFDQISLYLGAKVNYEALREKLMSFASSFGRMGLDFRLLVLDELKNVDTKMFHEKVSLALMTLIEKKSLNLVDSGIVEMARSGLMQNNAYDLNTLPLDMIAWDDLVIYANDIINGLNDLRFSLSINQINDLFNIIQSSFNQLASWIDGFLESDDDSKLAMRASKILMEHFVPFMQSHFSSSFAIPLQDKWRSPDLVIQEPFVFKINSRTYEAYLEQKPEEIVKTEVEMNGGAEPARTSVSNSGGLSMFVHSMADQMHHLWEDDPVDEVSVVKETAAVVGRVPENAVLTEVTIPDANILFDENQANGHAELEKAAVDTDVLEGKTSADEKVDGSNQSEPHNVVEDHKEATNVGKELEEASNVDEGLDDATNVVEEHDDSTNIKNVGENNENVDTAVAQKAADDSEAVVDADEIQKTQSEDDTDMEEEASFMTIKDTPVDVGLADENDDEASVDMDEPTFVDPDKTE